MMVLFFHLHVKLNVRHYHSKQSIIQSSSNANEYNQGLTKECDRYMNKSMSKELEHCVILFLDSKRWW